MRRVRKHPVLDETEQLRGRVAQLEKENETLRGRLAEAGRQLAQKPKPDPPSAGVGGAARSLQGFSDSFAALSRALGGSDATRLLADAQFMSALGQPTRESWDRPIPPTASPRGEASIRVNPGRGDFDVVRRSVVANMRVNFGFPRNQVSLESEVLLPMELVRDSGQAAAVRAVRRMAEYVVETIVNSERTQNSFSRF